MSDQLETMQQKIGTFAKNGMTLLAKAMGKILGRTLSWAFFGFVITAITLTFLLGFDRLTLTIGDWNPLIFKMLFVPLYMLVGIGIMGYVGFFRGIGRTILFVGLEHGLVYYLLDNILKALKHALTHNKTDEQVESKKLTIDKWKVIIEQTIERYLKTQDELAQLGGIKGKLARLVRTILCRKIEVFLLIIIQKETVDEPAAGISFTHLKTLAFERVEVFFQDFLEGLMNKYLIIGFVAIITIFAIPPVAIYLTQGR